MSLNSQERGGRMDGATASGERAPQLRAGGYAAWKPKMHVHLQRHGAADVHMEVLSQEEWTQDAEDVALWQKESLAQARAAARGGASVKKEDVSAKKESGDALAGGSGAGVKQEDSSALASSSSAQKEALSDEVKAARRLVAAHVERSQKAYGAIYSALPEDLCLQVAHIPQGWAYGLWRWLETKFQSTEADNVGTLLRRWVMLEQDEEESFDAYRARVNELHALLKHAKQEQTPEMYALFLLDRLHPRYTQAVLALKNGTLLKDMASVDWESVAKIINAHERNERQISGETGAGKAMAARFEASKPYILLVGLTAAQAAAAAAGRAGSERQRRRAAATDWVRRCSGPSYAEGCAVL